MNMETWEEYGRIRISVEVEVFHSSETPMGDLNGWIPDRRVSDLTKGKVIFHKDLDNDGTRRISDRAWEAKVEVLGMLRDRFAETKWLSTRTEVI